MNLPVAINLHNKNVNKKKLFFVKKIGVVVRSQEPVISSFFNYLCFFASSGKQTISPSVPNGECLADVKKESNRKRELRFPVTYVIRKSSR